MADIAKCVPDHGTCERCAAPLDAEGYCTKEACPYSDHPQTDEPLTLDIPTDEPTSLDPYGALKPRTDIPEGERKARVTEE